MKRLSTMMLMILLATLAAACGNESATTGPTSASGGAAPAPAGGSVSLILGAYTTPREAYAELIPIFQKQWKDKT
ncbi:MAG TPA: hypothetical protein VD886_14730, partial [Herpetosiphonaceae bacterium]|nr:hypothetical protein [Herpetosiphonaceae bacterium]